MNVANSLKKDVDDTAVGWFGKIFGSGVATTTAGAAAGMYGGHYIVSKMLEILPIAAILLTGIGRFVIIILKIFAFHFASLFMMPMMFARENVAAISKFTMKILATMLELPLLVLAVYLAVTANSLVHIIGDVFGKKIILGMLENNNVQHSAVSSIWLGIDGEWLSKITIYLLDGVLEVGIAVFSLIIIYKIIITFHNSILDIFNVESSKELDNSLDNMRQENAQWGQK